MENTKIKPGKEPATPAFEYVDELWSKKYTVPNGGPKTSWNHHNSDVDDHDDSNWTTNRVAVVKRG